MSAVKPRVLIVEDDYSVREVLKELLEPEFSVLAVKDGEKAMEALGADTYALVITDLNLPGMSGMEVVRKLRQVCPETVSIILTGCATVESAVEAMKEGAFDYLTKPFILDDLLLKVRKALEIYNLKAENSSLREAVRERYSFESIIGKSAAMRQIYDTIEVVADSDSTILLLGETGTGKELIAKTIHYNSIRRQFPFIPVNCGAIPEDLLESELFGHEKGAFTGAVASRAGRFERAHRGTIFLDEIGDMPFHLQVKLLRVLPEREFERVGGTKTIRVYVRVVAATNHDLEEEVEKKAFRRDLFYRLNVIPMVIPPLRERKEDIPLLADHFLNVIAARKKKPDVQGISEEAMDMFINYPWPGNVRELENIIERIVILKRGAGPITPNDIPLKTVGAKKDGVLPAIDIPHGGISLTTMLAELEEGFIRKAMSKTGGVKSKAAELLGINRTTLIEKMRKKGLLLPESKA
ncbi:MAG: sigma-54-dependent Fis family transcriptional regulator [Deltaproteobacteria bacterium]|nr:sigma-54-dependent Fis family transcriptional regulator [Deltaproteobacteria bacterium]